MKKNKQMPRFYGKNVVQNAQRKYFRRKAMEANREKPCERPADAGERGGGKK